MTLRVFIIDDEPVARRRIRRLLRDERDVEIAGEYGDGRSAIAAIRAMAPDLVLLDVQMPEMDGFEVLQALGAEGMPACIFITAFDRYALRAFEVHAIDYLLKPIDGARLKQAVGRARTRIAEQTSKRPFDGAQGRPEPAEGRTNDPSTALRVALSLPKGEQATTIGSRLHPDLLALLKDLGAGRRFLTRLPVKTAGRLLVIDLADVDCIKAADNYVTIHAAGQQYLARETLGGLERDLDPARFVRIHRSTIVQVDRIKELQPDFHGDFTVVLRDGSRVTLSRTYRGKVEQVLGRAL